MERGENQERIVEQVRREGTLTLFRRIQQRASDTLAKDIFVLFFVYASSLCVHLKVHVLF